MKSKLPSSILRRIWALSDIDQDGQLDRDEFCVAMFLIDHKLSGNDLPDKLPPNVIPPSKKNLRKGPDKMGPSSSYTGIFLSRTYTFMYSEQRAHLGSVYRAQNKKSSMVGRVSEQCTL